MDDFNLVPFGDGQLGPLGAGRYLTVQLYGDAISFQFQLRQQIC